MSHRVRGVLRAERAVGRRASVGVEAQDLPAQIVRVLGALRLMHLADSDVELAVAAEDQVSAVVIAVLRRERVQQRLGWGCGVVGSDPRQPVQVHGRIRVVDVDPRLGRERRIEREPQQPLLDRGQHVDVGERVVDELAVTDHADVSGVLLREEEPAVGCERHVRRERQVGRHRFERDLGARGRVRHEPDPQHERERRSPKHPSSVACTT